MPSFADLERWLIEERPYAPAALRRVLGSVRRLPRIPHYGVPLEQIELSIKAFDDRWGHGPVIRLPAEFDSPSQFQDWRSQVRSAIRRFLGEERTRPQLSNDEWTALTASLETAGVKGQGLICIGALANLARRHSLQPSAITSEWLQRQIDAEHGRGLRRAVQAAVRLLQRHHTDLPAELRQMARLAVPLRQRRSVSYLPLPPTLARAAETWFVQRTRGGARGHRAKRRGQVSPARAQASLSGLRYVYAAMVAADLIDRDSDPAVADLVDPGDLELIIERELEGQFPWSQLARTTLNEYLSCWTQFVKSQGLDHVALREVIKDFEAFRNVKFMSKDRRDWCQAFMASPSRQRALLTLPAQLYRQARHEIASYGSASEYQREVAIAHAIAACAAAIWTSLPLRIGTMVALTYGGDTADVSLDPRRRLTVSTRAATVKNSYTHERLVLNPKAGGDPGEIVAWFCEVVRPLLLARHIVQLQRDESLLFCGISDARLREIWQRATLEHGVPMSPHQLRHALATLLANEPNADYAVIAALLGDTENTVRRNYAFIDSSRRHAQGQQMLADLQRGRLLGRVA